MKRGINGFIIAAALVIGLAGCAGGKITPAETILTACQTYNSALATISAQNTVDPLSADKVKIVDRSIALSGGVCDGPAPKYDATALDIAAVQGANLALNAILGGK